MEKCRNIFLKTYRVAVTGLFAAILFGLWIFSASSTSYLKADASELTFLTADNVWTNLAAALAVFAAIAALNRMTIVQNWMKRINGDEAYYKTWRRILLTIGFSLAVFWVLSTQYRPGADQAQVQKAVYMLHIRDYSMFAEDGYLAKYPNQLGLVWFSYFLSLFFGSYNYLVFQLCNAAGVAVIEQKLADLCGHCGLKRTAQLAVIAVSVLFFPLAMYSSFIYGNILGLACSLAALEREMNYFENNRKRDLMLSAVLIALAVQLKSNYLIFLIGMVIYAGAEMIKKKQVRWILVPALLILCHVAVNMTVITVSEQVSGYTLDQGASPWSWIAMGLQDGKRAPGWYNGYNSTSYKESGYNKALQAEAAKARIRESVELLMEDKWEALKFFTRKTASQWNNPTFQAFWNVQIRSAAVTQTEWTWGFTNIQGAHRCTEFLNLLQFVILSGALLFCVFGRNGSEPEKSLVLPMIFIGGFVFHLFWEAKCQYTISYFVLLIPYAVAGFEALMQKLAVILRREKKLSVKLIAETVIEKQFPMLVFAFVLINLSIFLYGGGKLDYLSEDTVDYLEYLEEESAFPAVEDGVYYLKTENGRILGLREQLEDGSRDVKALAPEMISTFLDAGLEIEVINYQGDTWLRFVEEPLYMTVVDRTVPEHQLVRAVKSKLTAEQKWKTRSHVDGGMYIMSGVNYALTYNEENGAVFLAPFVGDYSQIWYVEHP